MKKIFANVLSFILLVEIAGLLILAFICNPTSPNAYGLYNDPFDLERFNGLKGVLYNWLTWSIEPSTTGAMREWTGKWLISIPVYWGLIILLVACIGELMSYAMRKRKNVCYPRNVMIFGVIIASYLASYCLMVGIVS